MQEPEHQTERRRNERLPERGPDKELSPEERRRLTLAALRKPLNVLMLAIGFGFSLITLSVWVALLTLLTYAALVLLNVRDPIFRYQILGGRAGTPGITIPREADASPERRARWLPRGETRQKVEAALEVHRKVLSAIKNSDEVTRSVLDDAIPRLRAAAGRLVDLAHLREEAAAAIRELETQAPDRAAETSSRDPQEFTTSLKSLQKKVRDMDAEISGMVDRLLALRAKVVRVSLETGDAARSAATGLTSDLDDLNRRLDALQETLSPPDTGPDR